MAANVLTIPSSAPFAETLARGLIARLGREPLALSDATIYLPTRRAARTFGDAFARVLGGAALLPQFKALGDVDEDEFLFDAQADDLDIAPAIAPIRRKLLLAMMVRHWRGLDMSLSQASALASSLAGVMDELETQGARLEELSSVVPTGLAKHWSEVKSFLDLLHTVWPGILEAEGAINPAARRNQALAALANRLQKNPPKGPVIAAGSTGSIPATAELLRVIANLPRGAVVLPGLDRALDEASWSELDPGHPQFGLKQLLQRIDVKRADVADWNEARDGSRERVLREALRPAPTTDAWRMIIERVETKEIAGGLGGVSLVEAGDPAEEALAVALILREALEEKGATAALVTPDRTLARRVASELARWNVEVDDSAGRPLSHTPPGAFLCLLAEAADENFAPVPLLALLKHPLCTFGQDAAAFRAQVRVLDRQLRGPRPDAGLEGIAIAIKRKREDASEAAQARLSELQYWFAGVAAALRPLERALEGKPVAIGDALTAHLDAAARLAGEALWSGEAGEIAARFIDELRDAANALPEIEPSGYAALFRALAEDKAVRRTRERHPRLFILGPLEARLQSFDTLVLSGLNEGTWPRAAGADPWFSRPMRRAIGLEQPERSIGQAAHDFSMLAAGKRVVLTRALKSEGVPTVASRWLQRLQQLSNGLDLKTALTPARDYVSIAKSLGDPGQPQRMKRPAPAPPVEARPRELSVTDIETWVRDPYAIYAKRILKLRTLDPLDAEIGPMERGSAVHKALEIFVERFPGELPGDAALQLIAIADAVFADLGTPKAALALWRPRFANAAVWFVDEERKRRAGIAQSHVEIDGRIAITDAFWLYGRADRIDLLTSGGAAILDYKTGKPPTASQIKRFLAPQLLLEGAMIQHGGFGDLGKRPAEELLYLRFSGGREPGEIQQVDTSLIDEALVRLQQRVSDFSAQSQAYLPRVKPYRADVQGDYDHLSRVREWSLGGWEDADE
ncbi:MAG: double-strand break repair protein AddB [Rhizomicrobium sp.]